MYTIRTHVHTHTHRMDLNEILSFKPEKPSLKRAPGGEPAGRDADMRPPHAKVPRGAAASRGMNSHAGGALDMNSVSDEEKLRILQSLEEEGDEEEGEGLDAGMVKRMLLSFEKKVHIHIHVHACTCMYVHISMCTYTHAYT